MEQSPTWKADIYSAVQDIPCLLWQKSRPLNAEVGARFQVAHMVFIVDKIVTRIGFSLSISIFPC
jgi:hypothetical protein